MSEDTHPTTNVDSVGEDVDVAEHVDSLRDDLSTISAEDADFLTMEVTVDISDCSDTNKRVLHTLARQYERAFTEVVEKNRDYSWSFLTTGAKLAQSDGTPFDSWARSQAFGLLTRSGDKRERLIENLYGNGSAEVSDDPSTTALEYANYVMFLAFVLDNPDLAVEAVDD